MMPTLPKSSKSNDHSEEMFESGKFADVVIKTKDEKEIKAHNFFLSSSDDFDAMLNKHDTKEAQQKVIEVTDIDHDVLFEMIRFLYCDEAPMIKEMALDLLVAADKYNVQGLINECVMFLLQNVNTENYSQILVTADQLRIECLKDEAIDYIIENREEILPSETWKKIKKENVQLAMEVIEKLSLAFL
jgi:speckle-type POZ protein